MEQQAQSKKAAIETLWRRGKLKYKLDPIQKEMYDLFYTSDIKRHVWLLSRRAGKSYCLLVLALEHCIKKKNSIVKFIAPTKIQVNNILRPIFNKIIEDCPEDLKPKYDKKEYIYFFPNGSEIQLAGTDNGHAEKMRGGDADLWVIDEAGSCQTLDYIVKSILTPTTLITRGRGIIAGTPSKEEDHDYQTIYIEEAEAKGTLTKKTIDDNPRVTEKDKAELIEELGGPTAEATRRELYCEIVKSESLSVIPEFTKELEAKIVKEWPRPPFYDAYTSMDVGFEDLTAVLYGYYDFRAGKLIIEDEYSIKGHALKLSELAQKIEEDEKRLWKNVITEEDKKIHMRVSDIDYIVMNEIAQYSNNRVSFVASKKDDNDAAINNLRVMLANQKIIIHPRCVNLIRHLRNVRWYSPANHTKFARSVDESHYDFVDSIKMLVRAVNYSKNPYPANYNVNMSETFFVNKPRLTNTESNIEVYKKIFNVRRK